MTKQIFYPFLLITFLFSGCGHDAIKKQSAVLDSILIPIFHHVLRGQFDAASSKADEFAAEWAALNTSDDWEDFIQEDDSFYQDVNAQINDLKHSLEAHHSTTSIYTLEHMQCTFSDKRAEEGIEYYLDSWFLFKYDVDILAAIASDELLDLCEWEELEWQVDYVTDQFHFLSTHVYDLEYFDMERKDIQPFLNRIDYRLSQLSVAMSEAQRVEAAKEAHALQFEVMKGIYSFGGVTPVYHHPLSEGTFANTKTIK